ncbi:MAG: DUF58 domain-containing protein [Planctomycetota bacterium]
MRQAIVRRYHLHVPGLLYVGLTLVVGLAAVNRQNNLLFWILGVMLAALLISGMVSGVMMQSLRVKRLVTGNGLVGEPLTVRYAVTNRSRLYPAFGIHLEERPVSGRAGWPRLMAPARAWVMHLGPSETVHGEAAFWPRHRGEARFDQLRIWTTFPFGIVKKSITISQPQHTLIYPLLYELRPDVLSAVAPQGVSGTKISPHTGAGDDYYGMREFRPGDPLRQIAWKRTACLDQLVCIERTKPTPPRLRIAVNLTTPTRELSVAGDGDGGTSARALEERAISLAASIVHAADREGFEVGLTLPGLGKPSLLIRRGHWHRSKIMAALAGIDLDAPRVPPGPAPATHGERAGQIVVHPHRVEPAIGRDDALHLTARQLEGLAVRPIGWDPNETHPEDGNREATA